MTDIDILYKGVSIWDDVEISSATFDSRADGQVGGCSFRIKDLRHSYDRDWLHAGGTLELYLDGNRAWDGWAIDISETWAFPVDDTSDPTKTARYWQVSGYDRNILFTKRVQYDQEFPANDAGFKMWPAGTSDQEAILYALEHYVDLSGDGLNYSIDWIDSIDDDAEFKLGGVGQPMLTIFTDAQKMTGGVFFINPERTLVYTGNLWDYFALTDQLGWSPVHSEWVFPYRNVKIRSSIKEAATRAMVWGAGRGSDDPVFAQYQNDEMISSIGVWEWGDLFVNAYKHGTVLKRARTYVEGSPSHRVGHGYEMPFVTCDIFRVGITAGECVWFENSLYGYDRAIPVRKVEMTFPTKTAVKSSLEMTLTVDEAWSAYDLWEDQDETTSELINTGTDPVFTTCVWEYLDTFSRTGFSEDNLGYADNSHPETRPWYDPFGGGGG
jgi:hypothetical protein